jgi:hypothetical protein
MAKDKKGFILYSDQKELFEQLPNEKAGELIKFIMAYVNDENPQTDDLIINLAFTPIKQQLKRDLEKFEKTKINRSEAGKAGAEKRWQNIANDSKRISSIAKMAVNVNVNDNVKDIIIRKQEFADSLKPYFETYGKDMLNDFYLYWTEHGLKDKKLRFEKERTFGLERRLLTWSKNNFGNQQKDESTDNYMSHVMKQVNQLKQMQ